MKASIFIILLLSAIILWASCAWMNQVYPDLARKEELAATSAACGECHIAIYKEWKDSPHAQAWTREAFLQQTLNHQVSECLACHAPEPIRSGPTLVLREYRREEGVTCLSCHLVDGELAGPEGQAAPHPAKGGDPYYRSSSLCGTCHVSVYREWTAFAAGRADKTKTCQECHMPTVHRKTIQDEPWQLLHGKSDLRRHTFTATDGKLLSKAVMLEIRDVRAEGAGRGLRGTVRVTNVGVGHSIPPAGFGYRETVLSVRVLDASGRVLAQKKESWFAAKKTNLAPGEQREMTFAFAYERGAHTLVAELVRADLRGETKGAIARVERPVPSKPAPSGGGGP